jgi:hypothetical protein
MIGKDSIYYALGKKTIPMLAAILMKYAGIHFIVTQYHVLTMSGVDYTLFCK